MTDNDDGYIPGYGFYIPDTQKQSYPESLLQRVTQAISEAPDVFGRTNKDRDDGLCYEVCRDGTDDEDEIVVMGAYRRYEDACSGQQFYVDRLRAEAAINAMLATQ
jgi:hypothetical protein